MQICVLRNLGTGLPSYTEGQVVDCDNAIAESLISRGLAEAIIIAPAKPVEMKAVQPEPLAAKAFDKSPSKQGK